MTGSTPGAFSADPTYDPGNETYVTRWDPGSDDDLGIQVVMAVAAVADVEHTELTPLNDVVDPDALNQLFAPRKDGVEREGGHVTFTLSGYEVTVHSTGRIVIDPADERDGSLGGIDR